MGLIKQKEQYEERRKEMCVWYQWVKTFELQKQFSCLAYSFLRNVFNWLFVAVLLGWELTWWTAPCPHTVLHNQATCTLHGRREDGSWHAPHDCGRKIVKQVVHFSHVSTYMKCTADVQEHKLFPDNENKAFICHTVTCKCKTVAAGASVEPSESG